MKRDKRSVYYQAIQRWFVAGDHWVFPKWLIWLMIGFGGLLLIFLSTSLILRNRIKARTAELTEKNIELMNVIEQRKKDEIERFKLETQLQRAQKMEAIGTLAGGVAHDLNNILSGLVSYPELLLLELPEDSPLRKPILTIQKSGEKAASVVNDLLTLARRGVAVTEVLNLNTIISDYLKSPEFEKLKLDHSEVQVATELEENLLNLAGSPIHLTKTVMNLVSNAVEAMPAGGKIIVKTENRYVDQPVRGYDTIAEGDYVVFSVSDSGVGISSGDIDRIFEPFYTKKVMGLSGTGLGMAVVWGTVKDHNGYIDVRSIEDHGTTFTTYFPVTRQQLPRDTAQFSIDEYKGSGELILVVDDIQEQREIASGMLTILGYNVASVGSGEEAVPFLEKNHVDVLVLDMIMDPGIDGLDTYIKALEVKPGQKAVIASGFSETDRVKKAQELGAGGYVKKPYTLEKLGLAVRAELDNI
jgi:signal transduction histidine kinase/CheY-like chemotaxis protein